MPGLLLEGPLAHGPGAQGRVADVGGEVDALGAARSTASRYSGNVSKVQSIPSASAAGSMSSARSRLRTTRCRSASRTGASVNPQLPMTAVVTPCQHELAPLGIPEHLGVHVGVTVDEPRSDHVALGVDLSGRVRPDAAHKGDPVPYDADVGAVGAEARPVDHLTVPDNEVERHGYHLVTDGGPLSTPRGDDLS